MTRALLLDLDDTLVVEEPAAVAAFAATAGAAVERHPLDPRRLALDARACARELWHEERCAPSAGGSGSAHGGPVVPLRGRRRGAARHARLGAGLPPRHWRAALEHQGIEDDELAAELGERFGEERRARHETFEDAAPVLDALRATIGSPS